MAVGVQFNSLALTKRLLKQPGEWLEFYVQAQGEKDQHARNRANMYRIYAKRNQYPIEISAIRMNDGLIHCWGRWNETNDKRTPLG